MRDSLVVELTLWGPATQHVDRSALEWDAERVVERFVVMEVWKVKRRRLETILCRFSHFSAAPAFNSSENSASCQSDTPLFRLYSDLLTKPEIRHLFSNSLLGHTLYSKLDKKIFLSISTYFMNPLMV